MLLFELDFPFLKLFITLSLEYLAGLPCAVKSVDDDANVVLSFSCRVLTDVAMDAKLSVSFSLSLRVCLTKTECDGSDSSGII